MSLGLESVWGAGASILVLLVLLIDFLSSMNILLYPVFLYEVFVLVLSAHCWTG